MAQMQAVYYRAADGSEPVNDFIESLNDGAKQAALDNQIDRLNMLRRNDPPLPFPWSSQVEGEFRELRCHWTGALPGDLSPISQPFRPPSYVQEGHRQDSRGG